jgi:branched-chain amino acid aminotransferase
MTNRIAYVNGEYVDESKAVVSIFDSSLWYGDMVFDMCRTYDRKFFRLREHLNRLYDGLKILHTDPKLSITSLEDVCYKLAELNDPMMDADDEHRIMVSISNGLLDVGQGRFDSSSKRSTVIVNDLSIKRRIGELAPLLDSGINVVIPSQRSMPAWMIDPKIKNRCRLWMKIADMEVAQHPGKNNWALMLDIDGFISEGNNSNFFMVKNGTIYTPEGRNILRGVNRNYIFEISVLLGIPCIEKNIEPYDVKLADEAFVTGTSLTMLPVTEINHYPIGSGTPGPVYRRLLTHWSESVGVDIEAQLRSYGTQLGLM